MVNGHKIIIVTPGFTPAWIFDKSRENTPLTEGVVDEKWLLLNKYPLPSVEENEKDLIIAAEKHGYKTFDSGGDLGLCGSLNNFFFNNPQPPGTIWIGIDPDSGSVSTGFDQALAEVMTSTDNFATLALRFPWMNQDDPRIKIIAGYRVFIHPATDMTNVGATSVDLLMQVGGLKQPTKYWGGVESIMWPIWAKLGKQVGYLMDYNDGFPPELEVATKRDPRYCAHKMAEYSRQYSGSFADWLAEGRTT